MEMIVGRERLLDPERTPYCCKLFQRFGWLGQYYDVMYYESVKKYRDHFAEFQRNARADDERHLGEAALYIVEDYFRHLRSDRDDKERKHLLSAKIVFEELAEEEEASIQMNWLAHMWIELRPMVTEYSVELGEILAVCCASHGFVNALVALASCPNGGQTVKIESILALPAEYISTFIDRMCDHGGQRNLNHYDLKILYERSTEYSKLLADNCGVKGLADESDMQKLTRYRNERDDFEKKMNDPTAFGKMVNDEGGKIQFVFE